MRIAGQEMTNLKYTRTYGKLLLSKFETLVKGECKDNDENNEKRFFP
jgi:hypothetical protein